MEIKKILSGVFTFSLLLVLLNLNVCKLSAQPVKEGESLDKIVAIVGNEIIMLSDIKGKIALLAQQNPSRIRL